MSYVASVHSPASTYTNNVVQQAKFQYSPNTGFHMEFFFGQRKLSFRGWNHDSQVAAYRKYTTALYVSFFLFLFFKVLFSIHTKLGYGHMATHTSEFLSGKYNTNMRVFFFSRVCFSVPTVNMTFYINTSAYQFRISNCNEGIQEYKLSQLRLLFS